MKKTHEKLLIAALAGLIIASAAAFAIQPSMAAGYDVDAPAAVTGVGASDVLNIRLWPASFSQTTGALEPEVTVWVERCIAAPQHGSDWCLVQRGAQRGWVNASFLAMNYDADI